MTIVVYLGEAEETREWIARLGPLLPGWQLRDLEDPGPLEAVRYAVVWAPPHGALATFPNLKAVVSIGAGVDHVLRDPELPAHLPILRTTGPDMVQRLREYVALHVLSHHRELMETDQNQAAHLWQPLITPPAPKRRVGVMGLGNIAKSCAQTLASLGFDTAGWSRSGGPLEGVNVYAGAAGLDDFLSHCEILVCLLPLTSETRDILNAETFARLPKGARVINAGRGGHLVEDDLLTALENGQIGAATLDVFRTEPLPAEHPFWSHPRIRVTPHIASMIDADTGAGIIAQNILMFEATGKCEAVADPKRGY